MTQLFRNIVALLCLSLIASCKGHELYWTVQTGPEITKTVHYLADTQYYCSTHESAIFAKQLKDITAQCNQKLLCDLYKARSELDIRKLQVPLLETGIGCRFQYVVPVAFELKMMARNTKNKSYLLFHPNIKAFLPVSSKTKIYVKLGKAFFLNEDKILTPESDIENHSIWLKELGSIHGQSKRPNVGEYKIFSKLEWNEIKENLLDTTPRTQWHNSITLAGIGITRKLSSNLEADLSINGYTQREVKKIYYSAILGINYFFK